MTVHESKSSEKELTRQFKWYVFLTGICDRYVMSICTISFFVLCPLREEQRCTWFHGTTIYPRTHMMGFSYPTDLVIPPSHTKPLLILKRYSLLTMLAFRKGTIFAPFCPIPLCPPASILVMFLISNNNNEC